jgi:phosphomannomutase
MAARRKKLSELVKELGRNYGLSYYMRKDIALKKTVDKQVLAEKIRKRLPKKILERAVSGTLTFDGIKIILEDDSWLLIRPSGTEPLMRLYAETPDKKQTAALLALGEKML